MDFQRYDQFVRDMWFSGSRDYASQVSIAGLGAAGEAGEVAEKIKKKLRGDRDIHFTEGLKKELGDVLFYVTKLAHLHGFSLADVAQGNVDKLVERRRRTGTLRGSGDDR